MPVTNSISVSYTGSWNDRCGKKIVAGPGEGEFHFEGQCESGGQICNECVKPADCPGGAGPFIRLMSQGCEDEVLMPVNTFVETFLGDDQDELVSVDDSDVATYLSSQIIEGDCVQIRTVSGPDNTKVLQISLDRSCLTANITPEDVFGAAPQCADTDCGFTDIYPGYGDNCNTCEGDDVCKTSIPVFCAASKTPGRECNPLDNPLYETAIAKIEYESFVIEQAINKEMKYYFTAQPNQTFNDLGWVWYPTPGATTVIKNGLITSNQGGTVTHVPDFYTGYLDVCPEPDKGIHAWRVGCAALLPGNPTPIFFGQHRLSATGGELYNDGEFGMTPVTFTDQAEPNSIYNANQSVPVMQSSLGRLIARDTAHAGGLLFLPACTVIVPFIKISTFITNNDEDAKAPGRGKLYFIGSGDAGFEGGSPFSLTVTSQSNIVTRRKLLRRHGHKCPLDC